MEFMTTEYVKIEAEKGEIPSIECSLKHHQQGRDADKLDLINAIEDRKFGMGGNWCACCELFPGAEKCRTCPLYDEKAKEGIRCCNEIYQAVDEAFGKFENDYSNANFKAFQEAEGKLCTYIEGVLERKKAEKEKKDCKELCWGCSHKFVLMSQEPCKSCTAKNKPKESTPALRHGDYGYDEAGTPVFAGNDGMGPYCRGAKYSNTGDLSDYEQIANHQGNILDDLALRAEDLEEFTINDRKDTDHLKFSLSGNDIIVWFNRKGEETKSMNIQPDRGGLELYQKLGQMLATAKRKQKSK